MTAWRCCSRRRSTRRTTIPATSRAIRPASARTAANTPMPPRGRSSPSRGSAKATKAAGLFSMLNPINHARTPLGPAPLQGRALCRRRRCLCRAGSCRARRLDLVHRLGRLAVPRRHRRDPGSAPDRLGAPSRPLHSGDLAGLRDHAPPRFDAIRHPRRQSRRCRKGDRIGADRRNRGRRAAASVRSCPRTARAMKSWSSWAERCPR